jgi:peptide/nickel transport system ATP-binding protein
MPASSNWLSMNTETGTNRLAVGLASSPVHSNTPIARTTVSGFFTTWVCASAATGPPVTAKPAKIPTHRRIITSLDAFSCQSCTHNAGNSATLTQMTSPMPNSGAPLLQVSNLMIAFGANTVVDGVSFAIPPGQTLGLVGESGSGKSATSLALLRLLPPTARVSGSIVFDGQSLETLPEAGIRKRRGAAISMIFQEPMTALNPVMRVGEQIAEALLAHHPKLLREEVRKRVVAAMHEVALPAPESRLRDYPHQFSGGQRQRILIAMALINRPQLLIADEPTTALDVTVQAQILALLRDLRRSHSLAMLFISHDLAVVSQIADSIAVMQHGRIVEQAATAQLFRSPQHAYTRRLLASAPTMHSDRDLPLASLA